MSYRDELPTMPATVREFANYKAGIQGCSEKTVGEYVLDLRTFFRYLTAVRNGISPDSDEFDKADLTSVDLDFVSSISTMELLMAPLPSVFSSAVTDGPWQTRAQQSTLFVPTAARANFCAI